MSKQNNRYKYVFTVEGETEKWYLKWLERQIKECSEITDIVTISPTVQQSPLKFSKSINSKLLEN